MLNRGFTLLEVLISIVILSIITIVTSSFLQSSIQSREDIAIKSNQIQKINFISTTLRSDIMNAVNIDITDFRGLSLKAKFKGEIGSNGFIFITELESVNEMGNSLARVEYMFLDNVFLRRQYFSPSPADPNEYIETILFENIDFAQLEFSDGKNWFLSWPHNEVTSRELPKLVKVYLEKETSESYTWIIPNYPSRTYE